MSLLNALRTHLQQRISLETEWLQTLVRQHGSAILGRTREDLLRNALRRGLPAQLSIRSGYVADLEKNRLSRQTDILIADYLLHPPFFEDGEVAVISPASLRGAMEAKTNTDARELRTAFANIACMKILKPETFGLICAFQVSQAYRKKFVDDVMASVSELKNNPVSYQPYEDTETPMYDWQYISNAFCTLHVARRDGNAPQGTGGYFAELQEKPPTGDYFMMFYYCQDPLAVAIQRFLVSMGWEEIEKLYPREYADRLLSEPFAEEPIPIADQI